MIKEVDKSGNSNIYTQGVYQGRGCRRYIEGEGDTPSECINEYTNESMRYIGEVYTNQIYIRLVRQIQAISRIHRHSAAYAKHRVLNAGWYINPLG